MVDAAGTSSGMRTSTASRGVVMASGGFLVHAGRPGAYINIGNGDTVGGTPGAIQITISTTPSFRSAMALRAARWKEAAAPARPDCASKRQAAHAALAEQGPKGIAGHSPGAIGVVVAPCLAVVGPAIDARAVIPTTPGGPGARSGSRRPACTWRPWGSLLEALRRHPAGVHRGAGGLAQMRQPRRPGGPHRP